MVHRPRASHKDRSRSTDRSFVRARARSSSSFPRVRGGHTIPFCIVLKHQNIYETKHPHWRARLRRSTHHDRSRIALSTSSNDVHEDDFALRNDVRRSSRATRRRRSRDRSSAQTHGRSRYARRARERINFELFFFFFSFFAANHRSRVVVRVEASIVRSFSRRPSLDVRSESP